LFVFTKIKKKKCKKKNGLISIGVQERYRKAGPSASILSCWPEVIFPVCWKKLDTCPLGSTSPTSKMRYNSPL